MFKSILFFMCPYYLMQIPSLRSALPLLDLHGIRRLEFHQLLVEDLRQMLLESIVRLSTKGPCYFLFDQLILISYIDCYID